MKSKSDIQVFDLSKHCEHKEIKRYKSGWHCSNCATRFYVAKAKPRSVVAAVAGAFLATAVASRGGAGTKCATKATTTREVKKLKGGKI